MSESLVYIICKTSAEADSLGEVIVERRLAACVNIIDGMRSIYWWDGKVERGQEAVLIAKTRTSLVDELTEAIKAMHGYEVPCVVVMPITGGNSDFLSWIREETKEL
jgi:periplasmic divalent cation tolerance protein